MRKNTVFCFRLCLVAQSCAILCDPMDCCQASLIMGILQARILEWVVMSPSKGSSQHRDRTQISPTAGRLLSEVPAKPPPTFFFKVGNCYIKSFDLKYEHKFKAISKIE